MKTKPLSIDLLNTDSGTQARVRTSPETVDDYAEVIAEGNGTWPMGPLDVFHDGTEYFLADGFHRVLAAQRTGRASIPCRIHKGNATDARIFGMTANDKNGLRMTRADKRACVEWLLDNFKLTQKEIAEKAGVCERTVRAVVADRKVVTVQTTEQNRQVASVERLGEARQPAANSSGNQAARPAGDRGSGGLSTGQNSSNGAVSQPETGNGSVSAPAEEWRTARSKAKKTAEALMRALDDLNDLKRIKFRDDSVAACRAVILSLDAMK